jgi:hypothetical protein
MKQVKILLGIVCMVFLASCNNRSNNAPTEQVQEKDRKECQRDCANHNPECKKNCQMKSDKMCEEQKAACEKWKNFDNLTEQEQRTMLSTKKAEIDRREAEMKAAKDEFEAKWKNFENLTIAEQKELLDKRSGCHGPKKCCKGKPGMDKK